MKTNEKGQIAELKAELRAVEKGYVVSRPTGNGARYDLVIDDGTKLHRVQVKYTDDQSTGAEGSVAVQLRRRNELRQNDRVYTAEEIDAVIVYIPRLESFCWLPPEVFAGKTAVSLRYDEPKGSGGQLNRCKFVKDYAW